MRGTKAKAVRRQVNKIFSANQKAIPDGYRRFKSGQAQNPRRSIYQTMKARARYTEVAKII